MFRTLKSSTPPLPVPKRRKKSSLKTVKAKVVAQKKTRKEQYAEKHDPKVLNPKGLTEQLILEGLQKKTIVFGSPPADKKYTSQQWQMGMRFLYEVEEDGSRSEIQNWFFCEICGWTTNLALGGGTGNLLHHAKKHFEGKYKFSKSELVELLQKVAEHTQATETIPDFKKILPSPEKWYPLILLLQYSIKYIFSQ